MSHEEIVQAIWAEKSPEERIAKDLSRIADSLEVLVKNIAKNQGWETDAPASPTEEELRRKAEARLAAALEWQARGELEPPEAK